MTDLAFLPSSMMMAYKFERYGIWE